MFSWPCSFILIRIHVQEPKKPLRVPKVFSFALFHSEDLSRAFAVISDPEKRRQYDMFGSSEGSSSSSSSPFYHTQRSSFGHHAFEAEISSPEEIFRAFFGGAFDNPNINDIFAHGRGGGNGGSPFFTRVYRTGGRRNRQVDPEQVGLAGRLVQLIPFLVMLLISLFGSWFSGEAKSTSSEPSISNLGRYVSLNADPAYPIARRTVNLDIPYFSTRDFESYFGQGNGSRKWSRLVDLEGVVEKVYIRNLQQKCTDETKQRQKEMSLHSKDPTKLAQLEAEPLISCDALHNLNVRSKGAA